MDDTSNHFHWILVLIGLSLLLQMMVKRTASPVLAIGNRWVRWVTLSLAIAYLVLNFGWSDRPFWLLAITMFLGWFLLETFFNWISINALSRSDFPLFPRFVSNTSGQEWPMQKRLFTLRDWLRENGFTKKAALQAELPGEIELKCSIFESPDQLIRASIQFLPTRAGSYATTYSLSSQSDQGTILITDNSFIPFGGFYPDNIYVLRKTLTRSFTKLLKLHQKRMQSFKEETWVPWDTDPLDDANAQQQALERTNTELGFLFPHEDRDEHGRITWEGRYRVWKEIWLLNYLGLPRRY